MLHVDASLIQANASSEATLHGDAEWIAHLKDVYRGQADKLDALSEHALDSGKNATGLNTTDPDASLAGKHGKENVARPRYKNHRAVDDAHGVITAEHTTTGVVPEPHCLLPLLEDHHQTTQSVPATLVADGQYGTRRNLNNLFNEGIQAAMPPSNDNHLRTSRLWSADRFHYNPEQDNYTCLAGQTLGLYNIEWTRERFRYGCSGKVCKACVFREECCGQEPRRVINRPFDIDRRDQLMRDAQRLYRKLGKRRMAKAEGSFARAANEHGLKRSRWRGLARVRIQNHIIAAIQNLKILIKAKRPPEFRVKLVAIDAYISRILIFGVQGAR